MSVQNEANSPKSSPNDRAAPNASIGTIYDVNEAVGEPREIACVISWGEGADRDTRGACAPQAMKLRP
jgi:hypothetical protein